MGDKLGTRSLTQLEWTMIWKFLGLQKKLDALFDDGWVSLGLSNARARQLPGATTVPCGAQSEG